MHASAGRARLALEKDGDRVELHIQDNGAGIARDQVPNCFQLIRAGIPEA